MAALTDAWFDNDPFRLEGEAAGKLAVLKDARLWTTNVGHQGPASPAVGEVFSTFILPNMMAAAAQGMPAKQAVAQAEKQIQTIFKNWRQRGLVGGAA
jgi:multiple sugar transport system substrate-binding protein